MITHADTISRVNRINPQYRSPALMRQIQLLETQHEQFLRRIHDVESLDDPTTLESTDVTLGTRHQDLGMTDGFVSTAITIITTARTLVLPDVLHSYVAPECGNHILSLSDKLNDPPTALMSMY